MNESTDSGSDSNSDIAIKKSCSYQEYINSASNLEPKYIYICASYASL